MVKMPEGEEFLAPKELEITVPDPKVFYGVEPTGNGDGTGNGN